MTIHKRFASQFRHRPQSSISFSYALFLGNGITESSQRTRVVVGSAVLWPTPSLDDGKKIVVGVLLVVGRKDYRCYSE
jgi:hypothetical protein